MSSARRGLFVCLGALLTAARGFGAPPPPRDEPPVQLAPFRVADSPLNFGLGISTWLDRSGIRHAMITRVDRGSLAAKAGLAVADRLISVDAKPVATCDASGLTNLFGRTVLPGEAIRWLLKIDRGPTNQSLRVELQANAGATGLDLPPGAPLVFTKLTPDASTARPVRDR